MTRFNQMTIATLGLCVAGLAGCAPGPTNTPVEWQANGTPRHENPNQKWWHYQFVYHPKFQVYYEPYSETYFWFEDGQWQQGPTLPPNYGPIEPSEARIVKVYGDKPHFHHDTVAHNLITPESSLPHFGPSQDPALEQEIAAAYGHPMRSNEPVMTDVRPVMRTESTTTRDLLAHFDALQFESSEPTPVYEPFEPVPMESMTTDQMTSEPVSYLEQPTYQQPSYPQTSSGPAVTFEGSTFQPVTTASSVPASQQDLRALMPKTWYDQALEADFSGQSTGFVTTATPGQFQSQPVSQPAASGDQVWWETFWDSTMDELTDAEPEAEETEEVVNVEDLDF